MLQWPCWNECQLPCVPDLLVLAGSCSQLVEKTRRKFSGKCVTGESMYMLRLSED